MPLRNRSTIPGGMLAPSGLAETFVNPNVQATARPAGVLLPPSPGYDSVRIGKNRFQGKGPTGGFRRMEFAEDVGGTGAALSVVPGQTGAIDASEWLPEADDSIAVIIADRDHRPGAAMTLHEGYATIPDMGDRQSHRPLSRAFWARLNPASALRQEYRQSPVVAVGMAAGLVGVVYLVATEIERSFRASRGRGVASEAVSPASGTVRGASDVTSDAIDKIGEAGDKAVAAIEEAGDKTVNAINDAAKTAKETVS